MLTVSKFFVSRVAVSAKDPIVSITSILTTSEELAFKAESGKKAQDQPQAMEDEEFDTSQGEEIIVGDIGTEASFLTRNIGSKVFCGPDCKSAFFEQMAMKQGRQAFSRYVKSTGNQRLLIV